MTEDGIKEGRLQNPKLNKFAPVILPWVGAVYTAHMNVSVAVCFSSTSPDIDSKALTSSHSW
jgi:hypothetical protein